MRHASATKEEIPQVAAAVRTVRIDEGHDLDHEEAPQRAGAGVLPPQQEQQHAVAQVACGGLARVHTCRYEENALLREAPRRRLGIPHVFREATCRQAQGLVQSSLAYACAY